MALQSGSTDPHELVVNWHVTESCNFRCQYCFAKWTKCENERELWRTESNAFRLLDHLYQFFSPTNRQNPYHSELPWRSVRLSLAGGEPTLLGERLIDITQHAKGIGFDVSLITNGSKPLVVQQMAPYLSMIGLSLDSANNQSNDRIGRLQNGNTRVDQANVIGLLESVRQVNPAITIKINSVINTANVSEDMSGFIESLNPDRWKVMRMLPTVTNALSIEQAEFRTFVERHRSLHPIMSIEDNIDMECSYLMIDPLGRFFQNKAALSGYVYSRPILDVGAKNAFDDIEFDFSKFVARYPSSLSSGLHLNQ